MEKNTRQSDAYSLGDEDTTPYFLPSTFSPWRGSREELVGDDEPSFIHSDPPISPPSSPPPPEASKEQIQLSNVDDRTVRPPLPRQASYFDPTVGVDETDRELMLRPPDDHGRTEVVITAGGDSTDAPEHKRGGQRRTKFKEMLSRSLSSTKLNKNRSASPNGDYNRIREEAMLNSAHNRVESHNMAPIDMSRPHTSEEEEYDNYDTLAAKYERPPLDCHSRRDVYVKRRSWTYIVLATGSMYSTLLSGLWFVVSIYQPRYGRGISSSEGWKMAPSTATLLCTLIAKSIELSFVTVFVALLGQILTRRGFVRKAGGITLAEMTMRNWVIQPGSLLTYWEGIPRAAPTILGTLTLLATICSMLYTTASDAMVSPKLKFGAWESRELEGLVKASYANPYYIQKACTTPIDKNMDMYNSAPSCLDVQYSGQSYHNLLSFMGEWQAIHEENISTVSNLKGRPTGKHNLFDNTTMVSSWVETQATDPVTNFAAHGRVINNVTLAMPHPGVYSAATDSRNDILQPDDLAGVGEYSIRASVVSPTVNVMCVNMARDELAPLVYTSWPNARNETTDIPGQNTGIEGWFNDVPPPTEDEWLNRTAVDDIFRWGPKYQRRPPVFQLFPIDFNMITNTSVAVSDSVYVLSKSGFIDDYTLCELRSWVSPMCSTEFDVSGISGSYMRAHCEDPLDTNSYVAASGNNDTTNPLYPTVDWRNVAEQWRLSMDLNGGTQNNNASNARIMTNLILRKPQLDPLLPSMAEAFAVLASSTLVSSSLSSTYRMEWLYKALETPDTPGEVAPGIYEPFRVSMRTQQYTSSHVNSWQAIFYAVLGLVFVINVACLIYVCFSGIGLVTDYTEPQNLFAVAINSPPSHALMGSCGHGPDSSEMVVPWRVGYSTAANHYFFEEAGESKGRPGTRQSQVSGSDFLTPQGRYRNNYKRLSASRTWL